MADSPRAHRRSRREQILRKLWESCPRTLQMLFLFCKSLKTKRCHKDTKAQSRTKPVITRAYTFVLLRVLVPLWPFQHPARRTRGKEARQESCGPRPSGVRTLPVRNEITSRWINLSVLHGHPSIERSFRPGVFRLLNRVLKASWIPTHFLLPNDPFPPQTLLSE